MKANELVKKYGVGFVKEVLLIGSLEDYCSKIGMLINHYDVDFSYNDLKQLVESHELVEAYGGLNSCREKTYMLHELTEDPEPIKQAIADVESCQ